jgi:hypothetical protein
MFQTTNQITFNNSPTYLGLLWGTTVQAKAVSGAPIKLRSARARLSLLLVTHTTMKPRKKGVSVCLKIGSSPKIYSMGISGS